MGSSPPAPNPSGDYLVLRLIFLNLVCVALFPLRWSLFSIGVEASTFEFEGRDAYTLPFDHLSFLGSFSPVFAIRFHLKMNTMLEDCFRAQSQGQVPWAKLMEGSFTSPPNLRSCSFPTC